MNRDLINIVLNLRDNRIYIDNKSDEDFIGDIEIKADDNSLWKIENDCAPSHAARWHQPKEDFFNYKKIGVLLYKRINKIHDVDPFGEEDWEDNEIFLEKNWKLTFKLEEV